MRNYNNVVLESLRTFEEYDLFVIPRNQNILANGLSFLASTCEIPHPNKQYTVEVKHCPLISINMRHWEVFGSDKQIEKILQSKEYEENIIDSNCEEEDHIIESLDSEVENQIVEYVSVDKQLDDSDVNISLGKDVHKLELHETDPKKRRI